MTELERYEQRQAHSAHCPCDNCLRYDVERFRATHPQSGYFTKDEGEWVRAHRQREDLNWTFERGHCVICGGDKAYAGLQIEHFYFPRWDIAFSESKGLYYVSIRSDGTFVNVVYRDYLEKRGAFHPVNCKDIRTELYNWAGCVMNLNPEHIKGHASRTTEDGWLEIRFSLAELVEEDYETRLIRIGRRREEETRNATHTGVNA